MLKGMILEGGAMRGLYTAGALDVLMENGIEVDGYIGVSAGISFGCNYKSKQIGRVLRYNMKYMRDPRFSGIRSLIKTGDIFGADFCYHEIPEKLDIFDYETFVNNPVELYTVATDAESGKSVYYKFPTTKEKDLLWMRASSSMPLVSNAVVIDGMTLFDGGMSDSIPIKYFMSIGYDKNLVILTRPREYRKKEKKLNPIMRSWLKKYPELLKTMENRSRDYNNTLEELKELEKEKKVLIIAPTEDLHVGRIEKDKEKVRAMYNLGRSNTEEKLDEIKAFFSI